MKAVGRSDRGRVRSNNEDVFAIRHGVLVVVDGMGGPVAGEIAAAVAVEELARPGESVERFAAANAAVYARTVADPALAGMGCVGARVSLVGDIATVAHVGDCRVFTARQGGVCALLTRDHTVRAEHLGRVSLNEAEAFDAPGGNQVTRDLGAGPALDHADVDVAHVELADGDLVLICSDGLTDHVYNSEVYALLRAARQCAAPLPEVADRLVDLALERGGKDNITVVVARVGDLEEEG